MKRREFDKKTKAEIKKRCKVATGYECECCHAIVSDVEVDHEPAEALVVDKSKKLTAADGQGLCKPCHKLKTAIDKAKIAKAIRVEARYLGAVAPKQQIRSRGFGPRKPKPEKLEMPPRRAIYEDIG